MLKEQLTAAVEATYRPPHPIRVLPSRLSGTVSAPPSKSVAHRALICAALSGDADWLSGIAGITGVPSEDIRATVRGLMRLTGSGEPDAPDAHDDPGEHGRPGGSGPVRVDCGESGSTLRFLVPLALALGRPAVFEGSGRLPQRPLRDFSDMFAGCPVRLTFPRSGDSLPLAVSGRLTGGIYPVPGHISSQYISGLLMALPLTGRTAEIELTTPLQSRPYVDLTVRVMADFGVAVAFDPDAGTNGRYRIEGGQSYRLPAGGYAVEGDYSQAAFWLAARFIGQPIEVTGLRPDSAQGDRAVLAVLDRLADIRSAGAGHLTVDLSDIPDLLPILGVAAATVPGTHRFCRCARLRLKESDRLEAVMVMLRSVGVRCDYDAPRDVLTVAGIGPGGRLIGHPPDLADVPGCRGDHRMAMAMTVAGLCSRYGTVVDQPACVAKSWPDFYESVVRLGGRYMEASLWDPHGATI